MSVGMLQDFMVPTVYDGYLGMKRKSLSLRQALILLGIGVLVGYPAGHAAGGCIWGAT